MFIKHNTQIVAWCPSSNGRLIEQVRQVQNTNGVAMLFYLFGYFGMVDWEEMRKKYFSLRVSNFPPIHYPLNFWIFDISDICFALPLPSSASDHRKYQLCQHFLSTLSSTFFNLYCKLMEFAASCICI